MKKTLRKLILLLVGALSLASCSSLDDFLKNLNGETSTNQTANNKEEIIDSEINDKETPQTEEDEHTTTVETEEETPEHPEETPEDNPEIVDPPEDNLEIIDTPEDDIEPENYQEIPTILKRMPAEFEPVSMIKVTYPNMMPMSVYKSIAEDTPLLVLVDKTNYGNSQINSAKNAFANAGVNLDNLTFIDAALDDGNAWIRDFSPFYVFNNNELSIVDFTYNRPQRTEQNSIPSMLANYFNMPYSKMSLTHTGGNLMQDGRGTAFSDDLVVQENSNNKDKVISQMSQYTGTDNYVITIDPQGDYIAHIDCWAKIVAPDKIIVAKMPTSDSRYQYYEQVANELGSLKCAYGYNYKIYRVEEPGGEIISPYTNSLISNKTVYLPLGNNSNYNQKAIEVYQKALPGYTIKGIPNTNGTFLNTDALHCRTHEIPDKNMLFIDSREVYSGYVPLQSEYVVKTNVVSYAGGNLKENNINIYYSINGGDYQKANMNQYKETTNYTFTFSNLHAGDSVKYYIEGKDSLGNSSTDPTCSRLDPHSFTIQA